MSDKFAHDEEYDGIREHDNPLPFWWLLTFYGAVVFSAIYWYVWHIQDDKTLVAEFEQDKIEMSQKLSAESAPPENIEEIFAAAVKDPARLQAGRAVYVAQCQVCHADKGQGLIGPNFTDKHWKHGKGTLIDIKNVIETGVLDKGMPPWKTTLKPEDIINVSVFIKSLEGTSVPGGKAPEGILIE